MQSFLPLNLLSAPEAVAATANSGSTVEAQLPIATFAAVRPSIGLYLRVVAALMVLSGFFGGSIAAAQGAPEWTWMGGSSSAYQPGVYGTLGTPATGNIPESRFEAASWTDSSGNLWLFGGYGDAKNTAGVMDDLWKFNPSTNEWTWVAGGGSGVYGTPGKWGTMALPAAANTPGSRVAASTWSDSSGNLWLFGGVFPYNGSNSSWMNDLWEFSPSENAWIWMGGNSGYPPCNPGAGDCGYDGVYGTLGTPATLYNPGSRAYASSWTDSNGHFWLFGGMGFAASNGLLNDLWEFDPSTREWAWMGGSDSVNQPGVYATLGTPAIGNTPGARYSAASWTDGSGNLWLFGGYGLVNDSYVFMNDLWEFNISTSQWAWMGGSKNSNQNGVYGTLGVPAAGNRPGARAYALSWTDSTGNLWVFGGDGYSAIADGTLNDLWEFNPSTNQWAWMGGSDGLNQPGVYGKLGTPAAGNTPANRRSASGWTDSSGNLWLFGGDTWSYGWLNDLWVYRLSLATPPAVSLSATNLGFGSVSVGASSTSQTVTLTNTGGFALSVGSITETGANASSFVFANNCGTAMAAGASCSIHGHFAPTSTGAMTAAVTITDNATGSPQTISLSGTGTVGSPAISLSATSLSYGTQAIGTPSASQTVTLTNTGSGTLTFGSIAVTGTNASSFGFANDCGTALAAGANCIIRGHFEPTTTGPLTAAITITDDAAGSPQTITLSGTGEVGVPAVALSATNLSYGTQAVGTTSASQTVTLTNTGNGALTIGSIAVTGAGASSFGFANSCGTTVAVGANCIIRGHFAPATAGPLTAAITITDNAAGSPQSIALSGTGVSSPPIVSLSATSLAFGTVGVARSSASQAVTLTNTGGETLSIGSITVTGANASSFVFGNSCGSTLAGGASCSIHGHFAPTSTGAMTAAITITDNATGALHSITLSGTGSAALTVSLSATSLSYGSVFRGQSSAPQSVTLTNTGAGAVTITSIAVTGSGASSYVFANSCGASLAAGASCIIHGHFAPTTSGSLPATITITDNATGSPQTITLSGTGI